MLAAVVGRVHNAIDYPALRDWDADAHATNVIAVPLEVAVAGGVPVLSQKVLEAVFGDQAVRRLAATARTDLLERVAKLLDDERERYDTLLAAQAPDPDAAARLEGAVAAVERAR